MSRAIHRIVIAATLAFGCASPAPGARPDDDTSCKPGAACDDGDLGTANDVCREGGACVGAPIVCPAHDCVQQATPNGVDCDVTYRPDGAVCDDGSVCTDGDRCAAGSCRAGAPMVCDDGDPCTEDACDSAVGCTHAEVPDCGQAGDCVRYGFAWTDGYDVPQSGTFDVVDGAGAYHGGAISPGINLSLEALHMAAAQLPRVAPKKPQARCGFICVALGFGDKGGYPSGFEILGY